jgi:hypothetical protein
MCTCVYPSEGLGGAALTVMVLQMVSESTLAVACTGQRAAYDVYGSALDG